MEKIDDAGRDQILNVTFTFTRIHFYNKLIDHYKCFLFNIVI
jgi:hypothetical protein